MLLFLFLPSPLQVCVCVCVCVVCAGVTHHHLYIQKYRYERCGLTDQNSPSRDAHVLQVSSSLEAHVAMRVGAAVAEGQRGKEAASATGGERERESTRPLASNSSRSVTCCGGCGGCCVCCKQSEEATQPLPRPATPPLPRPATPPLRPPATPPLPSPTTPPMRPPATPPPPPPAATPASAPSPTTPSVSIDSRG